MMKGGGLRAGVVSVTLDTRTAAIYNFVGEDRKCMVETT